MKHFVLLLLSIFTIVLMTACVRPSPKRSQHILNGFSVARIDSAGKSIQLHHIPSHSQQLCIQTDQYLHTTTCKAMSKDSVIVQYWYWDQFGQLMTYRKFNHRGDRKLEILVDNPNLSNAFSNANLPTGDTFIVQRFRHNQPWTSCYFEGKRASAISKSNQYQVIYYPNGHRHIKLDLVEGDKVSRARLWDPAGKCMADTVFSVPPSIVRLRPNPTKFLENISH